MLDARPPQYEAGLFSTAALPRLQQPQGPRPRLYMGFLGCRQPRMVLGMIIQYAPGTPHITFKSAQDQPRARARQGSNRALQQHLNGSAQVTLRSALQLTARGLPT